MHFQLAFYRYHAFQRFRHVFGSRDDNSYRARLGRKRLFPGLLPSRIWQKVRSEEGQMRVIYEEIHLVTVILHRWENRMAGVRTDNDILERVGWEYVPKNGLKLNVLMFGFDSLSRMTFMRKLPKSYDKLKSLNSIVLEGYNIIGDGTPQALIPILTGV